MSLFMWCVVCTRLRRLRKVTVRYREKYTVYEFELECGHRLYATEPR